MPKIKMMMMVISLLKRVSLLHFPDNAIFVVRRLLVSQASDTAAEE
jgi:hypothetical protein